MIKFFKNFRKDESGAVTVDWVVLTAAMAALAGIVYTSVSGGVGTVATNTGSFLTNTGNAVSTTAVDIDPTQ
ncbi:Flp family type IVb pilin [Roseobacteraceae bacterium NS-SX3]